MQASGWLKTPTSASGEEQGGRCGWFLRVEGHVSTLTVDRIDRIDDLPKNDKMGGGGKEMD